MRLLTVGRAAAAFLSLSTFVFLFLHDSWRRDNLFLVPDLILCALLLVGALLPPRAAPAALTIGFSYAAGVLTTSVLSYAVRSELGLPSLIGAVTAATLAVALARSQRAPGRRRVSPAASS
ncbi:hypothetical protein AB0F81_48510 [Actinoplanes sp. NPDC024001]|uniref:hypothetical protein n=1 Tax=Actinoplanes sp. NPDC024001 TaxID=3154598 RepID=UPI0034032EC0